MLCRVLRQPPSSPRSRHRLCGAGWSLLPPPRLRSRARRPRASASATLSLAPLSAVARPQLTAKLACFVYTPQACSHCGAAVSSAASVSSPRGIAQLWSWHLRSLQQLPGSHCRRSRQQLCANSSCVVVCFLALSYPVEAAVRPASAVGSSVGAAQLLCSHLSPVCPARHLALPCLVQVPSTLFGICR